MPELECVVSALIVTPPVYRISIALEGASTGSIDDVSRRFS